MKKLIKRRFCCGECDLVFDSTSESSFYSAKPGEHWHTAQGFTGKCPRCKSYAHQVSLEVPVKINVLGTEYAICILQYADCALFKANSIIGYCDNCTKQFVICDLKTHPNYENENPDIIEHVQKECIRREIVRAFLNESGLYKSAVIPENDWSKNEETADWLTFQSPKIYKAWQEAGVL